MVVYDLATRTMLADYLAPAVNKVDNSPASYAPADNLVAAFLYTFQIYGDFAGYSLMAIGFAWVGDFSIGPNFRCWGRHCARESRPAPGRRTRRRSGA